MRTHRTPVALVSMLAAAALLAACEKKTTTVTDTPGSTTATTSSTTVTPSPAASNAMAKTENAVAKAGDKIDDATITGKVKTALIADPDVKALKIDVDTKDNVVTLNGTANTQASADKAVTIAKGVEGVKSVESRLTVKP